jgi:hypothetical protein
VAEPCKANQIISYKIKSNQTKSRYINGIVTATHVLSEKITKSCMNAKAGRPHIERLIDKPNVGLNRACYSFTIPLARVVFLFVAVVFVVFFVVLSCALCVAISLGLSCCVCVRFCVWLLSVVRCCQLFVDARTLSHCQPLRASPHRLCTHTQTTST